MSVTKDPSTTRGPGRPRRVGAPLARVSLVLPAELYAAIRSSAQNQERSVSAEMRKLMRHGLRGEAPAADADSWAPHRPVRARSAAA